MLRTGLSLATMFAAALVAGCSVQETEAPPLAGPSEMALSINMQASPDFVYQDGASQSSVTIEARNANSQPVGNLTLRVGMAVNGIPADFGTLSSRTVVTDGEGRARVTYTAPPQPIESVGDGQMVTLVVTPVGTDARAAQERTVDIRVVPPGVILPPAGALEPSFTFSPTEVLTFQSVTFDASATKQGGVLCGGSCTYIWSFGDGGSGTGQTTSHEFRAPGSYVVTLRVVGTRSQQMSTTQTVTVGAGTTPSAAFVFSPPDPSVSQDIFFNASASTATPPRRIVSYAWDFGSGRTGTGVTTVKRYDSPGEYNVTLTVTDDANQTGTVTQSVTVGSPGTGLTARMIFSPTAPLINQPVFFDARESDGPLPITTYQFDFGDNGGTEQNSTGIATRSFASAGTFVVRLTVIDSSGTPATTTVNVSIGAGNPTAVMTFSPASPTVGTNVSFNASGSTSPQGLPLEYSFDFGDGESTAFGPAPTVTHQYDAPGSYVVRLTVRDSAARTATTTTNVTINSGDPVAVLTASPTNPTTLTNVFFDASASTSPLGLTLNNYEFTFGDGTPTQSGPAPTTSHVFASPGTYVVRLTVRDAAGRTGTTTITVTVS